MLPLLNPWRLLSLLCAALFCTLLAGCGPERNWAEETASLQAEMNALKAKVADLDREYQAYSQNMNAPGSEGKPGGDAARREVGKKLEAESATLKKQEDALLLKLDKLERDYAEHLKGNR